MTVLNYFNKQKERILAKHIYADKTQRSAYDILAEIDALAGLNTREREEAVSLKRPAEFSIAI